MRIALIGYGQMGKSIDHIALEEGIEIVARIDPKAKNRLEREISRDSLKDADICIEFTAPNQCLKNLEKIIQLKKPVIVGTSGWYDHLEEIQKKVEESNGSLLYGENFSIGANLFIEIVKKTTELFNPFSEFDLSLIEKHHHKKKDIPSSTAYAIAQSCLEASHHKHLFQVGEIEQEKRKEVLQVQSIRCGAIPGTHTLLFDGPFEQVSLEHMCRDRKVFAKGALMAAQWLYQRKGFYSIHDLFYEVFSCSKEPIQL